MHVAGLQKFTDTYFSAKKNSHFMNLKLCVWQKALIISLDGTHTCLMALCPGLPRWAGTRKVKVKPIWILLKQETVSGSGITWAICKSAPRPRQITTPSPHHSVFYRPDALPAAQPTASKHWWKKVDNAVLYTIKPGQYIGNCKSAQTDLIRKKPHGLNKLFAASRESIH